jgi:hypothetical protein
MKHQKRIDGHLDYRATSQRSNKKELMAIWTTGPPVNDATKKIN